jgi:hypothetical protein
MRPSKHKAAVITLAITTCITIVTAALIQTNAAAESRLTSDLRISAPEIQNHKIRPRLKVNRFKIVQNNICTSDDGRMTCVCPMTDDDDYADLLNCCKTTNRCYCCR